MTFPFKWSATYMRDLRPKTLPDKLFLVSLILGQLDESGKVYTFHLRPDAKWSNGDRTVATEFVEGLRRAVDPKTASGSAGLLAVIKGAAEIIAGRKNVAELGVTAIDESTLRIELEHPAPFILQILSQPIATPVHLGTKSVTSVANLSTKGSTTELTFWSLVSRDRSSSWRATPITGTLLTSRSRKCDM